MFMEKPMVPGTLLRAQVQGGCTKEMQPFPAWFPAAESLNVFEVYPLPKEANFP